MSMRFDTSELRRRAPELRAGEEILLSGTVYTARDAAHKRMAALLAENRPLPFALEGAAIYYAGPTPARAGRFAALRADDQRTGWTRLRPRCTTAA